MNILDQILANQEVIKSQLTLIAQSMGKTPTVTLESTVDVAEVAGTTTVDVPKVDAPASAPVTVQQASTATLDSDGVPWDIRIHSGKVESECTRTKGGVGTWQKRRGVDKAEHARITAELKAAQGATTTAPATTTGTTPPPPPANTGTTPPPPPANTAASTTLPPPPATNEADVNRKLLNDAVIKLTKDRNVILDVVLQHVEENYGVDNVSAVPSDKYVELTAALDDWSAHVETAQGTVNAITRIYQNDPEVIKPHILAIINQFTYVSVGVAETAQTVGQVQYSQLSDLNNALNEFYSNCRKAAGIA